jgi:hypothetical protein
MKIANRHMLYAEALAGWFAASSGISVWLSHGMLKELLRDLAGGGVYQAFLGGPLILSGWLLIAVCALELIAGRGWDEGDLRQASLAREWLNISLCLTHFALLVALVQMSALWAAPAVTLNCVGLIALCGLAAYKARRLCWALDPHTRTERLIEQIPRSL